VNLNIINDAADVPFAYIVQDLIAGNVEKSEAKQAVYKKMKGVAAIDLPDIEAAITLIFDRGSLTIEPGIKKNPAIIIQTDSDLVTDLNMLKIRWGLPYYFDDAGRRVLGLLFSGKIKIKGLLSHPVLLTRLTIIMSVMKLE
jgi:hypothetical protein